MLALLARVVLWPLCVLAGDWAGAVLLLAVLARLLGLTLGWLSRRQAGALSRLKPRLEALRAQVSDDRLRFTEALMALCRRERVPPRGGFLPGLLKVLVHLVLGLYGTLRMEPTLARAPFLWVPAPGAPAPL